MKQFIRWGLATGLALILIASSQAYSQAGRPAPTPPHPQPNPAGDPLPIDGSPTFHRQTLKLAATHPWRPPTRSELEARGKTDPSGRVIEDVLGQQTSFWSYDFYYGTDYSLTATLQRIGTHCYVYVENGQAVSSTVLDNIVAEFDNNIYGSDTSIFGGEPNPGIDGDTHITILLLNIRDPYYYGNGNVYVAGYFTAADEYSKTWVPHSNEREMFYMDTSPATPGSNSFFGTLAHEFQHMIHWNHDPNEDTWVNEGLSDLAIFRAGYGHPYSHVSQFLHASDTNLTTWSGTLADYGAAYLWSLYFWEKFGGDSTIHQLVSETANGSTGIDNVLTSLGYTDRFADIFPRWTVANYLDDTTIGSAPYDYGYTNLNLVADFFQPTPAGQHSSYPVSPVAATVQAWASDYILFSGTAGDLEVTFNGDDAGQFGAYLVTSTSADFSAGTNAVSSLVLDGAQDGPATLPDLGNTVQRGLLIALHPSSNAQIAYTYQAAVASVSDTLNLDSGWNLVSFSVSPVPSDASTVFAPISAHLTVVTSYDCAQLGTTYYPGGSQNTLTSIDALHGYWIKTDAPVTMPVTGTAVLTSTQIPLCNGWNLVPYLPATAAPVSTALSSLGAQYTAVIGYDRGAQTYYRQMPPYMNTLQMMQPGKAYWIYMTQPLNLSYGTP
ncbi:MAG: hypothetical protein GXP41_01455 [Chloroflexi bacterium]|nr:hypothetical protein [Chloroflexota bacterium]